MANGRSGRVSRRLCTTTSSPRDRKYLGRVFVVDAWYIGRYEPLRNHQGNVIGMLYVGVREAVLRAWWMPSIGLPALVALVCMLVAGVIAFPAGQFDPPIRLWNWRRPITGWPRVI